MIGQKKRRISSSAEQNHASTTQIQKKGIGYSQTQPQIQHEQTTTPHRKHRKSTSYLKSTRDYPINPKQNKIPPNQ